MTQKDKELLLRDLYARLPYGVKVHTPTKRVCTIYSKPHITSTVVIDGAGEDVCLIKNIKPYLLPLSSMTEEQRQELESLMEVITIPIWGEILSPTSEYYDWLNKNHFDYRGLIGKGLAIDATGLNLYK